MTFLSMVPPRSRTSVSVAACRVRMAFATMLVITELTPTIQLFFQIKRRVFRLGVSIVEMK